MKKMIILSTLFITAIFLASCGGQVQDGPNVSGNPFVNASNEQLAKYPVKGFGYKSSRLPAASWGRWAKVAAPVVKGILDKLPSGYALEVRGHCDSRGPEEPVGNKPGNIKISTDRARVVYNSLKGAGITSGNLKYRGVGSAEPHSAAASGAGSQRRVTFVIVPK